jgi:hypothetical protein
MKPGTVCEATLVMTRMYSTAWMLLLSRGRVQKTLARGQSLQASRWSGALHHTSQDSSIEDQAQSPGEPHRHAMPHACNGPIAQYVRYE